MDPVVSKDIATSINSPDEGPTVVPLSPEVDAADVSIGTSSLFTEEIFAREEDLDLIDVDLDIELFFDSSLDRLDFKLSRAEFISVSSISDTRVDFETRRLPMLELPAAGYANLVKPLGNDGILDDVLSFDLTLEDFLDNDFDLLGFFVNEGVDAKEVSPTIDPDLRLANVVTRAPSSTKLLDFLESDDGLATDDFLSTVLTLSSSSNVNVEARLRAGVGGDSLSFGKGADADT